MVGEHGGGLQSGSDEEDTVDEGGEAPCYAHLVGGPMHDIVDDEDIERLVVDFYRQVAMDDLLGPIFAAARVDWNAHVATLVSFWSWQLLGRPGYDGHPLRAHEPIHRRTPLGQEHFERWLELFVGTLHDLFVGPRAEMAEVRGRKMAAAMKRLLDGDSAAGDEPIEATLLGSRQPGRDVDLAEGQRSCC